MPEGGEPWSKFAKIFHQISLYNKLKKKIIFKFPVFPNIY